MAIIVSAHTLWKISNKFKHYNISYNKFMWFCGLYEAEGSFSKPPPSQSKGQCVLKISSRDKDVIDRVSSILKVSTVQYKDGSKYMYRSQLVGIRAMKITLMMSPFLGNRRRKQIKNVLKNLTIIYNMPLEKKIVKQIERKLKNKEKLIDLSAEYNIGMTVISSIKNGNHYNQKHNKELKLLMPKISSCKNSKSDLHWLAGILEGDGSFLSTRPRISFNSIDKDTTQKVSKLCNSKYVFVPSRNQYFVMYERKDTISLMKSLYSLMGNRRKKQLKKWICNKCEVK